MGPHFTNMLAGWQWAIVAALPLAVVLLYFLRLKRRPVQVPSTYLWQRSVEDWYANTLWQRLRHNALLFLQLALLGLAILALWRPSWETRELRGRRIVLLVDASASMQATDVRPSRLEEAKRRAGEIIDQMPPGGSAMLVSFSNVARVEQAFTDDRGRLHEVLAAIRPTARSTSLAEALAVVAGLARADRSETTAEPPGDIVMYILSDGNFPPVENARLAEVEPIFVPIGTAEPANLGIIEFRVAPDESRQGEYRAWGRIENSGPADATCMVRLFHEGRPQPIDAQSVSIAAKNVSIAAFDLTGVPPGVLRLAIEPGGDLTLDDEAWALLGPARRPDVLLVTAGNRRLREALSTRAAGELASLEVQPPEFLRSSIYRQRAAGGHYRLVIYDGVTPIELPESNTVWIGCLPPGGTWKQGRAVRLPQILDTEVSHPLLQWLDFGDLRLIEEARPLQPPPGGRVLVDSESGPLIVLAARGTHQDLAIGFPLLRAGMSELTASAQNLNTDWPLRTSFPTFFFNVLRYMAEDRHAEDREPVRPGGVWRLDAGGEGHSPKIRTPKGQVVDALPGPGGSWNLAAEDLGIYRVEEDGHAEGTLAVNLADRAESDLGLVWPPTIKIGARDVAAEPAAALGRWDIWKAVVAAGLGVCLWEWYTYMRRVYY